MVLKPPLVKEKETTISEQNSDGFLPFDGQKQVNKKAWIVRLATLEGLILVAGYNLYYGLVVGDPIVVQSTLLPVHAFLVFAIGWFFYRNRAEGKTPNDLVSIIIPIYNQKSLIKDVITAVYRSTYHNIEVIAVNDGSKDGTKEILESLAMRYPDLKVIHRKNGGKRRAVATGFSISKGKYVVLIDSDSIVDEHAIEEIMKAFNANPRAGGIVGNGKVLNSKKNTLTKLQDAWYDYAFNIHKATESTIRTVLCCSGCLAAYRREAIAGYVPYWAQSTIQYSDDRALTSYVIATPWAKRELAPPCTKTDEVNGAI